MVPGVHVPYLHVLVNVPYITEYLIINDLLPAAYARSEIETETETETEIEKPPSADQ